MAGMVIDNFLNAITNGDAQSAGQILEQQASSGGIPPALVDQAASVVGLTRTNGAWVFQQPGAPTIPTVTQTGGNGTQQPPTQPPTNPPITPAGGGISTAELVGAAGLDNPNDRTDQQALTSLMSLAQQQGLTLDPTEGKALLNSIFRLLQAQQLTGSDKSTPSKIGGIK